MPIGDGRDVFRARCVISGVVPLRDATLFQQRTRVGTATHISQFDNKFSSVADIFEIFSEVCLQVAVLAHLPSSKNSKKSNNANRHPSHIIV